ncbi:MAG: NAD-dependent epimerase/dehydratase family protein [Myxococcales bacterium]|nr:NAD-dependent epimerase/dehydratase family protein [Myxococcales bacterium]
MTLLITGSTGFLGRHLHEALASKHPDQKRVALCRDRNGWEQWPWAQALDSTVVLEGGLHGAKNWQDDPSIAELDGIFHCAAMVQHSRKDTAPVYETNVEGTRAMVRLAAAKGCRLVYVSTSGTVGCFSTPDEWADETAAYCGAPVTTWPYYDSKIRSEMAARSLAEELGVELVIIRPPIMLGPGDHRFRTTGNIIRHMRRKLPFLLRGGVHFIDIRDAAAALVEAMDIEEPKPVYHLSGTACSVVEFFSMVERASGIPAPKMLLPPSAALKVSQVVAKAAELIPGERHSPLPDPVVIEMAARYWGLRSRWADGDLGWAPRDGQLTIDETVAWLREAHPQCATAR